ncbi:Coiled-coil domain-containing protein [Fasciola hepatica]|uniref:DNA-directed primase/polymerase protein n=1 Tax=Fasciola hepatica TaxID=6192 RepID=A0A4E0R5D7_FASHE|nr:Coiled-coil domain-containing protein [Fasciola hepatica]
MANKRSSKWDLEAAVANIRQLPIDFKSSIFGPTAVRKVFFRQDEALEFARPYGSDMMVFSYESDCLGQAGPRMFLACSVQSFFHYYCQMPQSARCHYEVIAVDKPAKLYLDLEFSIPANPEKNGPDAAAVFVTAVCAALDLFYHIPVQTDEILILDASTPKKFSQHVIVNNPRVMFASNLEQGPLIRLIIDALETFSGLRETIPTDTDNCHRPTNCTSCQSAIKRLIEQAFPSANISPSTAKSCFVLPAAVGSAVERPTSVSICDSGVYTRNRNFRVAGSRKLNGLSVLWPVGVREPSLSKIWPTCVSWARTLVTFFPSEPLSTLICPVIDCTCTQKRFAPPRIPSCCSQEMTPIQVPLNHNILTPELTGFVESVLDHWFERGRKCQPVQRPCGVEPYRMKPWRVNRITSSRFTVSVDKMRFCERIEREHRSNHIMLVFDLLEGCYYQRCLDPDCRALDYRSPTYPIPQSVLRSKPIEDAHFSIPQKPAESSFEEPMVTEEDRLLCAVLDECEPKCSSS